MHRHAFPDITYTMCVYSYVLNVWAEVYSFMWTHSAMCVGPLTHSGSHRAHSPVCHYQIIGMVYLCCSWNGGEAHTYHVVVDDGAGMVVL